MKRKIAMLLASVMIITMLPTTLFARSTSGIVKTNFIVPDDGDYAMKYADRQELKTDAKDGEDAGGSITVAYSGASLEDADGQFVYTSTDYLAGAVSGTDYKDVNANKESVKIKVRTKTVTKDGVTSEEPVYATFIKNSESRMDIVFDDGLPTGNFSIPILARITDSEATLTFTAGSQSKLTTQETPIQFARRVAGKYTITNGDGKKTNISASGTKINDVIFDEVTKNALKIVEFFRTEKENNEDVAKYKVTDKKIELRLPSNFEFVQNDGSYGNVEFRGGLDTAKTNVRATIGAKANSDGRVLEVTFLSDKKVTVDQQTIYYANDPTSTGKLIISGLTVRPIDKDKNYGEVTMIVGGSLVDGKDLVIGEYVDYGVKVTVEDKTLPVIIAGRYPDRPTAEPTKDNTRTSNRDVKTLKVTVEENIANSWIYGRDFDIVFPEGVKVRKVDVSARGGLSGLTENNISIRNYDRYSKVTVGGYTKSNTNTSKAKLELTFYVSAAIDFEGDIVARISGTALDLREAVEVVLGKVVSPITVETKTTEINLGRKAIKANDIVIKENIKGALKDDQTLALWVGDFSQGDANWLRYAKVGSYEVTEGNLQVDKVDVGNYNVADGSSTNRESGDNVVRGAIRVKIKGESTRPATLVLKNIEMNTDRTPASGSYALSVGGNSLIENYNENAGRAGYNGLFDIRALVIPKSYTVVTPPVDSSEVTAKEARIDFIDGKASSMKVENDSIDLVPNAYIDAAANRTMVPLRAASVALGINNDRVGWDGRTKTASVLRTDGSIISVRLLDNDRTLYMNGVGFKQMDIAPININGSVFLPISAFANAMGVSYLWNQETKTVVFNPSDDTIAEFPNAIVVK